MTRSTPFDSAVPALTSDAVRARSREDDVRVLDLSQVVEASLSVAADKD